MQRCLNDSNEINPTAAILTKSKSNLVARANRMETAVILCCLVVSFFMSNSLFECGVGAFNLDPFSITVLRSSSAVPSSPRSNPAGNFFGFSQAFLREREENWLLVGAPKANVSWEPNVAEPGTVYKCRLADDTIKKDLCTELRMDVDIKQATKCVPHLYDQWFGGAMDASNRNEEFVVCGCRQKYLKNSTSGTQIGGICLSRRDTNQNVSFIKSKYHGGKPIVETWDSDNSAKRGVYYNRFVEWGISVRLSTEGYVVMGGPGLYQWQGGLFVNFDYNRSCSIENVTLDDSYLGYSVTSIQRTPSGNNGKYLFAGGAPRYQENGTVYVFETTIPNPSNPLDSTVCNFTTVQNIISQHYGSYFGASILSEDTDADGSYELFIGAPFENLTLGDEGAVHYYVRNETKNEFVESKVLTGIRQGNARFGTAIASIGDVNLDGYNDVVIGSPFENEGRGAVYIFNGSPTGIEDSYSQRIAASNLPELSSIKSFGHSLSSGRDIDGNVYPDVSIGAYMSDSVAVIRARPVHTVSANIWFPEPVISWQRPNCSKTSDDQRFFATLMISFNYTIPDKEKQNIKDTYILLDHRNRPASLDPNQKIIFTDRQSSIHPLQFFVVPCLAKQLNDSRCVSFLTADRHATYLRLFDRNFFLGNIYTEKSSGSYTHEASFQISENLTYDKNMSMQCIAALNYKLISDENGYLTPKQMALGEMPQEAHFRFARGRYLPCIKNLAYDLSIESESDSVRRAFLQNPQGTGQSMSFKDSINFTVEDIDQPLNKSWTIIFPRYPKNIATPMRFKLNISRPSFTNDSRASLYNASVDRIIFDALEPVLNPHSKKTFTGEIGFKKECGDDDVCHPNLSVNMTLSTGVHSRGLVIGSQSIEAQLKLRIYVENSGEAAYSVRVEIVRPSILQYSKLELEDQCNQVTGTNFDIAPKDSTNTTSSSATMQGLTCDVENQIHTNGSVAFEVILDTSNFREESDYPKDFVEFQYRHGTHGQIRNGTTSLNFTVPIRYEAQLDAFGQSTKDDEIGSKPSASESKIEVHKQEYQISNVGPGLMPSVTVDLMLPDDSIHNVSKVIGVKVTVTRLGQKFDRIVNETRSSEVDRQATATARPAENGTRTSTTTEQSIIYNLLRSAISQDVMETIVLTPSCRSTTKPCSGARRYNIGSMYKGDKAVVSITIQFNVKKSTKLNYTSLVLLRPHNLSEAVKTWKEEKAEITSKLLRASTILRPTAEVAPIPIWIILVGVGVGLLHIVATVLILNKCGFFRRNKYEKMKNEMKRDTRIDQDLVIQPDTEVEQHDGVSQYDNELLREQMSLKSQSQYSATGSYGNGAPGDETKKSISTVDALHAQHPGVNFNDE